MSKIVNAMQKFFSPLNTYIGIILLVGLFILVAFLGMKYFFPTSQIINEKFSDVANENRRTKTADIYLFFADWCPYCVKAKPEWQKLKDEYNGKGNVEGSYTIVFHDVDCTKQGEDNPEVASLMQTFGIGSFPSIKLTTDDGKKIDYDAKVSHETLVTFLKTSLA